MNTPRTMARSVFCCPNTTNATAKQKMKPMQDKSHAAAKRMRCKKNTLQNKCTAKRNCPKQPPLTTTARQMRHKSSAAAPNTFLLAPDNRNTKTNASQTSQHKNHHEKQPHK